MRSARRCRPSGPSQADRVSLALAIRRLPYDPAATAGRHPSPRMVAAGCVSSCDTVSVDAVTRTGVRRVGARTVWVAKEDGSDIIQAGAIAGVGRDYNGNV